MASFIEQRPIQFSPYVSQLPDNYVQLLAVKQGQHDEGVQKVESYIQSLSGLDVVRDVDKQYLNNKIQSLTSEINKTAGSTDWSNKNIVNQTGAMAAKIYNDPKIQNAVAGTFQYKKLLTDVGEAKKSGKGYSVQNEWDALSSVQEWLANPEAGKAYSGKTYTPYVDVNEKVRTYFKDKKPNWIVTSDPMSPYKDANGNIVAYTMVNNKKEYIDPAEVERELAAILQPEDYNQLGINGRYSGRIYSDPTLFTKELDRQQSFTNKTIQNQIDAWKGEIQKNQGNAAIQTQLNGYISRYQGMMENNNRTYSGYKQTVTAGGMDAVKEAMYTQDYIKGWGSTLGYTKNEVSYDESPAYKAVLAQQKSDREFEKHALDMEKTRAEIEDIRAKTQKTLAGGTRGSKSTEDTDESGLPRYIPSAVSTQQANQLATNFYTDTQVKAERLADSEWKTLYDFYGETVNWDESKLNSLFNVTTDNAGNVIVRPKENKKTELGVALQNLYNAYDENPKNLSKSVANNIAVLNEERLVVNARKNAYNKVAMNAEKQFNVQQFLQDRPTIRLSLGQSTLTFTPQELLELNNRVYNNPRFSGTLGAFAPENVATFQTEKDRFAINTIQKSLGGREPLNRAEQAFVDNLNDLRLQVTPQLNKLNNNKQQSINQQIRPFTEYERSYEEAINTSTPEARRDARSFVQRLYDNVTQGTNNTPPIDRKDFAEYLGNDDTTYRIEHNPDGSSKLIFSNSQVADGTQEIIIPADVANSLELRPNDPYRNQRQLLGINRTLTGVSYTGLTRQDALSLRNPYLSKYSVKYNIEKYPSGNFKAKLSVFDLNSNSWVRDTQAPIVLDGFNSLEAVDEALNSNNLEQIIDLQLKPIDGYR